MNNNIKNKESKKVNNKEWKQFKSNYTFLILGLLIYALRPLRINKNSNELSYALEILNKRLSKDNYKKELNLIIRFITSQFVKIGSNNREKIIEKSSTKSKILDVLKLLLNINSFTDFYIKISKYEFGLTNNKDFFNFISSFIHFEDSKKSLNNDMRSKYIIFLIKRFSNSPLNSALGNLNKNNIIYDDKIKKYKNFLINVSTEFFKNIAKNNKVEFVNSKIVLKSNLIPTNKNSNSIPSNKNSNSIQSNKNSNSILTNKNIKPNELQSPNSVPLQNSSLLKQSANKTFIKKNILVSSPSETNLLASFPMGDGEESSKESIILTQTVEGGNKSKSINFKDMWWLKKYK